MSCQPMRHPVKGPPLQCSYCYGECDGTWGGLADHVATCPALGAKSDTEVWSIRERNDPKRTAWAREAVQ